MHRGGLFPPMLEEHVSCFDSIIPSNLPDAGQLYYVTGLGRFTKAETESNWDITLSEATPLCHPSVLSNVLEGLGSRPRPAESGVPRGNCEKFHPTVRELIVLLICLSSLSKLKSDRNGK